MHRVSSRRMPADGFGVGAAFTGHLFKPNRWHERVGFLAGGILLVWPGWTQALLGAALSFGLGWHQRARA